MINLRYVKRFSGTRKVPAFEIIFQFQNENGEWIDFPEPEWESSYDENAYKEAESYEYLHSPR